MYGMVEFSSLYAGYREFFFYFSLSLSRFLFLDTAGMGVWV